MFVPTGNLVVSPAPTPPATDPAPPGVIVQVGQINAGSGDDRRRQPSSDMTRRHQRLGQVRRAGPGPSSSRSPPAAPRRPRRASASAGTAASWSSCSAEGSTVQAFDASTGAAVGQFSSANLGLNHVEGIAFTGPTSVLSDPTFLNTFPGGGTGYGVAVGINVAASLASGTAQPTSIAFYNDQRVRPLGRRDRRRRLGQHLLAHLRTFRLVRARAAPARRLDHQRPEASIHPGRADGVQQRQQPGGRHSLHHRQPDEPGPAARQRRWA